jgi:hypothetical protein
MIRKLFLFIVIFILLLLQVNAIKSIECEFKTGGCNADEAPLLYANKNFYPPSEPSKVLSSNVAISVSTNYNKALCCRSEYGNLETTFVTATQNCPDDQVDLMYFTNSTNARAGVERYNWGEYDNFNLSFYEKKSCVKLPAQFGTMKLTVDDRDLSYLGYECLYKTNSLENGHVSSCDATFATDKQYDYTVWGQIFESTNTLNCNEDCVSTLTNRVNAECGEKLASCRDVPIECNGALLGSWVYYNSTYEILCESPWDKFRSKVFTDEKLEVTSVEGECDNLISKKYSVIVDNEMINMRVFVCED